MGPCYHKRTYVHSQPPNRYIYIYIYYVKNKILKFEDLIIYRNTLLIYNFLNNNYKLVYNSYFKLNKLKNKFILPLMK